MWRVIVLDGKGDCWLCALPPHYGENEIYHSTREIAMEEAERMNHRVQTVYEERAWSAIRYFPCPPEEWESHWRLVVHEARRRRIFGA